MAHHKYLIIGGGMTADAAVRGIRQVDPEGPVGLISTEPDPPYNRPPLTKGLWKGKPVEKIWRKTETQRVEFYLGRTAKTLDAQNKRITDEQGNTYTFEKLLLATGGTPKRLPFDNGDIIYYRTLEHYKHLRSLTEKGDHFAVIGGGFIGSEIAAALAMNGKKVVMLLRKGGILYHMFPRDLSLFLNDFYREKGVVVLTEESPVRVEKRGEQLTLIIQNLKTLNKREIQVDGIVAGLGIEPNVELAQSAGLTLRNGIQVDEFLRTSHPDIYSAGDVANFYNPALGERIRVEHEDNANTMGRFAGKSIAGELIPYHHLPYFYSDLFELGYEAVGDLNSQLEIVSHWKDPYREGVVYYLSKGRVRGVLLWNVWEMVDEARTLIAEPGPFSPDDLKDRLPIQY